MNIDNVVFGCPDVSDAILLNTDTEYDKLFAQFTGFTFPKNSGEAVREELNYLFERVEKVRKDPEAIKRFQAYDRSFADYLAKYLVNYKLDYHESLEFILGIIGDIRPIVLKLKYFHQRPRPYQLAYYYKLRLIPFRGLFSQTPSFPSMKAVESRVVFEVLGNTYPEIYQELSAIHNDVLDSRMALGLNYQSDIDVGLFVAETICSQRSFKTKYRL